METTSIRISKHVHDFIVSKGKYSETADQILRRLLKITKEADGIS